MGSYDVVVEETHGKEFSDLAKEMAMELSRRIVAEWLRQNPDPNDWPEDDWLAFGDLDVNMWMHNPDETDLAHKAPALTFYRYIRVGDSGRQSREYVGVDVTGPLVKTLAFEGTDREQA